MDSLTERNKDAVAMEVFAGGGEMGALMQSLDWWQTSLGPVSSWSTVLQVSVRLVLESPMGMCLLWGKDLVQIYNDQYRLLMGSKHPAGLGQPNRVCWPEVWHLNKPLYEQVLQGEAIALENALYPITRHGLLEDSWFNLYFTPIRDKQGKVAGVLVTVFETTKQVLSGRRLNTLHSLTAQIMGATTLHATLQQALTSLAGNNQDIPFALGYLNDTTQTHAQLISSIGVEEKGPMALPIINLESKDCIWPIAEALTNGTPVLVDDFATSVGGFDTGSVPQAPNSALLLPLTLNSDEPPIGVLIVGINPRLPFDEHYRHFLELVGAQVGAALGDARSREQQQERLERMASLDRTKTAFFNNVSHEFRTPLMLLSNPLEDVLAGEHGQLLPPQREQLASAQRNAMRLLKLVNTLLDFSQIEEGRIQRIYEPTDLATFTQNLASVFRSAIETAGLQLIVDCPPLSKWVYVDREMWEKIVLNLISNALKFTFTGKITLSLYQIGDLVELKIRDTGIGIKSEELPRIFERFHRIHEVRARSHEGSGIGLALVLELVHLHGGQISVTSVVGEGTTFTVTLPTGTSHLPSEQISAERTPASTSVGSSPYVQEAHRWLLTPSLFHSSPASLARILLVDDNADMRDYLKRLLSTRWQVETAANGASALAQIQQQPPDLVLTDVMMPELDGLQLLKALRTNPQTKSIPVILLSARAGEEAAVEGLEALADDYLVKPFSARELMARVKTHLELAQLRFARSTNRLKNEFLLTVTHELQAPLVAILGWARLLQTKDFDSVTARALATIERNATIEAKLIKDLLDVASIIAGKLCLNFQRVDLVSLVKKVTAAFHKAAQTKNIQLIETITNSSGCDVFADGERLQQVISNLLENAIKFTPSGGNVSIQLEHLDFLVQITVSDTGIGIPRDFLPDIFERFTQAEVPSRHSPGGVGIGLAIARLLVEMHKGTIEATSDGVGQGAKFTVKLPLMTSAE
jgi:signal transduction histidine kinase